MKKLMLGALMTLSPLLAHAEAITRLDPPGSNFPIAQSVSIPAGSRLVFVSGTLPETVTGNTEAQARSVFTRLRAALEAQHLGLGDVIKLNVFLVGDPAHGGKLNFTGLQAAYTEFFATAEQPNKPARTAVQVAALPLPGALVEIEAIAAKAP